MQLIKCIYIEELVHLFVVAIYIDGLLYTKTENKNKYLIHDYYD